MTPNSTVFVIDDDVEVCQALRWLFESVNLAVETYDNAKAYLDKYDPTRHGCLIIDVRLPVMSGLELLEHLKMQKNYMPVILITGYGDIPMAVRAMKAGAVDFVLKPLNDQYLLETIQKCLNYPSVPEKISGNVRARINNLTKREQEVMNLILDGKLNKEIAYELKISISTVEAHRARVMKKMQVKNLAQLIRVCLQRDEN